MGFKATEAVEDLTYDFHPHVDATGTIPEPSTEQVDTFRATLTGQMRGLADDLGLDLGQLVESGGKGMRIDMSKFDLLLEKSSEAEKLAVNAVADLTGIPSNTLNRLPYRIKAAFVGWIVGMFLSPEA